MLGSTDFLVWGNNQGNLVSKSNSKCLTTPVPLSIPFSISSLCASEKHISFITKDGHLYSFGSNLDGRLGISPKNIQMTSYYDPVRVPIDGRVIKVQSGFSHVCALTENQELYSWGLGQYGALGTGQFQTKNTPTLVDLPKNIIYNLKQFSCGAMHTAYVTQRGDLYMCGSNEYGELGVVKPGKLASPIHISFHLPVQQVSCGVFYTLLLTKQGRVYGMGNNKYGQLGIGHKANESHPTLIRDLEGIMKVTAGYHSGAIDHVGNLYIWGSGSFGEILKPKKIILSVPIKDIAIRGFFGLAIGHTPKFQNRIYTWGNNTFGQLGIGNYEAVTQPQEVQTLRGLQINKIALGVNFVILTLRAGRSADAPLYRSPRTLQKPLNLFTQRKQIANFDDYHSHSHNSHIKSKSRQIYPRNNYGNGTQRIQRLGVSENSHQKNYQKLFLSLSQDYQILFKKYQQIEKQLSLKQQQQQDMSQTNRTNQAENMNYQQKSTISKLKFELAEAENINYQMKSQNSILKSAASKLKFELSEMKEQYAQKIEDFRKDKDNLLNDFEALSQRKTIVEPDSRNTIRNNNNNSNQIEVQYNKLLNDKQQIISRLTMQSIKSEEQLRNLISKLRDQKADLQNKLHVQVQKISEHSNQYIHKITQIEQSYQIKENKLLAETKSKTNNLQENLERQEKKSHLLEAQIQALKKKCILHEDNIKKFEILNLELENSLIQTDRKNKQSNQQSLKKQILIDKIEELEIQLNYEKQYNKKYQETVIDLQEMREKLYKQLNAEVDVNKGNRVNIQELKAEVNTFKKYKKQADEKSIQIEEFQQNFDSYKNKADSIIIEKEKIIQQLEDHIEKSQIEQKRQIDSKIEQISDLNNNISRQDKQINRSKDTIAGIKQQLLLKDQQIEHISHTRNALQKKTAFLQGQLRKQSDGRQVLAIQIGQCKRQMSKLKIAVIDYKNEIESQKDKSEKIATKLIQYQQQITKLKQEISIMKQKQLNLRKQNNSYREQLEKLQDQLQRQGQMNQELATANKQFAENQERFQKQITQYQRKYRELQSQKQSYTPRYDALLQRNRQLDQKNRQLGEMINKAIEIQAESYKNNILKQVELNTDQFLSDVQDEQEFKNLSKRYRREAEYKKQNDFDFKTPPISVEKVKDQPYTRLMKERLRTHQRKVSVSAQKLAHLLDINDGKPRQIVTNSKNRTSDYEKVNHKIQNFNSHKEQFITKIHSFAEKLKIL